MPVSSRPFAPGELIVRFSPEAVRRQATAEVELPALLADVGAQIVSPVFTEAQPVAGKTLSAAEASTLTDISRVYLVRIPSDRDVPATAQQLAASRYVEYAEPNYLVTTTIITPTDPYYNSAGSWGQSYADLWALLKIQTGAAWETTTGNASVVVAVVDTGLDATHPDINGNVWTNADEIAGNGFDDDGNGYIDDVAGWDYVNADNSPADDHGHGTHVAGTIAATGNNGLGVVGVAWRSAIMPLKFLNSAGSGYNVDGANAIVYAADNGARIINCSWGGSGYSYVVQDAINYAYARGVLVVVAAGNNSQDAGKYYPAGLDHVLTVGATDVSDARASFSNWGEAVAVAAPGVDILSLRAAGTDIYGDGNHIVGGQYYRANGTSMASPHVAGLAALLFALHPDWTNTQVFGQIVGAADNIDPLLGSYARKLGTGRINAYRALTAVPQPSIVYRRYGIDDSAGNRDGYADAGETLPLTVTLKNWGTDATDVRAGLSTTDPYLTITDQQSVIGSLAALAVTTTSGDPFGLVVASTAPVGHAAALTLTITASGGYSTTQAFTVSITPPYRTRRGFPALIDYNTWLSSPKVADLDGDGQKEIIAGGGNYGVFVMNADGTLRPNWPSKSRERQAGVPWQHAGEVAVADLDNDGNLEVIAGITEATWNTYRPDGNNGKVYARRADASLLPGWPFVAVAGREMQFSAPAVGDLDHDGNLEVVIAADNGSLYVLRHDGTLAAGWPRSIQAWPVSSPALADLDGDGDLELIIGAQDGLVHVFHHTGAPFANWPQATDGGIVSSPVVGDLDGDGDPEIVAGSSDRHVYVWHHTGASMYGWPRAGGVSNQSLGDVNGDGVLEVVCSDYHNDEGGHIYVRDIHGNSLSGWPQSVLSGFSNKTSPTLGNLNGDSQSEIMIGGFWSRRLFAWQGNGTDLALWPQEEIGQIDTTAALADLDSDGRVEVIALAVTDGTQVYIFDTIYPYVAEQIPWGTRHHDNANTSWQTLPSIDQAPRQPANLSAAPQSGAIALIWSVNAEGDIAGYRVYRSLTGGSGYAQINSDLVSTVGYTDTEVTLGTPYYYVVAAVDRAGHTSGYSTEVNSTVTDPTAPLGLVAAPADTAVQLSWLPNSEPDLAGYNLYRSLTSGGGYTLVNPDPVTATVFVDSGRTNGTAYYYVVRAIDNGAQESWASTEAQVVPAAVQLAQSLQSVDKGGKNDSAVGDLDNDGDVEALLLDGTGVRVYDNDGSGYFSLQRFVPTNPGPVVMALADFNNDGWLDLAVGTYMNNGGHVELHFNDRQGNLEAAVEANLSHSALGIRNLAHADLDSDGDIDLVVGSELAPWVLKNNGTGVFSDAGQLLSVSGGDVADVDLADVDGDQAPDLLISIENYPAGARSYLYRNDGYGGFTDSGQVLEVRSTTAATFVDVDADGDLDILQGNDSGNNLVYYNDGHGNYSTTRAFYTDAPTRYGQAVADFYNHGHYDVAQGTTAYAAIIRSDGMDNFNNSESDVLKVGYDLRAGNYNTYSRDLDFADFDRDADLDVLVSNSSTPHRLYLSTVAVTQPNTAPAAPSNLSALLAGSVVTLTWDAGSDAQTPAALLSYNLRVGTTPGGNETVSSVIVPGPGNAGQRRQYTLRGLAPGQYYWSVQTVDTAFARSDFAGELTFTGTAPLRGVQATPATAAQLGALNSTVVYTVRVTNTGAEADTFALTIGGNSWTTSIPSTTVGPLAAGDSADVPVSVQVPASAHTGQMDIASLTAVSLADGTKLASSTLTTTARDIGVALAPASGALSGPAGNAVAYTLQVTNTGIAIDTPIVMIGGALWPTDSTAVGSLPPDSDTTITVTVQIPPGTAVGARDIAAVIIRSQRDMSQYATSILTTTAVAETPPVTDLRAAISNGRILLTWSHVGSAADHYEVWRATNLPYFVPPQGAPIAPNVSPVTGPSYDDAYSGLGSPATNSFYLVRSVAGTGRPAPTYNRVGVFNFALAPGSQ